MGQDRRPDSWSRARRVGGERDGVAQQLVLRGRRPCGSPAGRADHPHRGGRGGSRLLPALHVALGPVLPTRARPPRGRHGRHRGRDPSSGARSHARLRKREGPGGRHRARRGDRGPRDLHGEIRGESAGDQGGAIPPRRSRGPDLPSPPHLAHARDAPARPAAAGAGTRGDTLLPSGRRGPAAGAAEGALRGVRGQTHYRRVPRHRFGVGPDAHRERDRARPRHGHV